MIHEEERHEIIQSLTHLRKKMDLVEIDTQPIKSKLAVVAIVKMTQHLNTSQNYEDEYYDELYEEET